VKVGFLLTYGSEGAQNEYLTISTIEIWLVGANDLPLAPPVSAKCRLGYLIGYQHCPVEWLRQWRRLRVEN
jgi:hypothetical protein